MGLIYSLFSRRKPLEVPEHDWGIDDYIPEPDPLLGTFSFGEKVYFDYVTELRRRARIAKAKQAVARAARDAAQRKGATTTR